MTVLESGRMIFRPNQLEDLDAYCEMEADAKVRRFVGGSPDAEGLAGGEG